MVSNNDRWSALSMKQKADLFNKYVKSGITDLSEIVSHYNKFADGGEKTTVDFTNGEGYLWKGNTPREERITTPYQVGEYVPSAQIVDFIKQYEAFVPYVYDDRGELVNGKPKRYTGGDVNGRLTIGYGETDKKIINEHLGKKDITEEEATKWLNARMSLGSESNRLFKRAYGNQKFLSQNEADALFSYYYNIGYGNARKDSTATYLKQEKYDKIPSVMVFGMKNKSTGKGITRRREAEQSIYTMGKYK